MSSTTQFLESLSQLNDRFVQDPEGCRTKVREQASNNALDVLLSSATARQRFEDGARTSALLGKKVYRVETWTGNGVKFNDIPLSDLLNSGDLITIMQNWLDTTYGDGQFRVFNHPVSRTNNLFTLVVSWDATRFENVDKILTTNRQNALERQSRREYRGENRTDNEEGEQQQQRPPTRRPRQSEGRQGQSEGYQGRQGQGQPPRQRNEQSQEKRRVNVMRRPQTEAPSYQE